MEAKLIKTDLGNYILIDPTKGVYDKGYLLGTSRESDVNKLSLKNCQAIENGYDLGELAKTSMDKINILFNNSLESKSHTIGFRAGWQQAMNIYGDKKFSEDDVNLAFVLGKNKDESRIGKLINSRLQQTEWDVIVEMEKVKDETKIIGSVKGVKGSGDKITTYKSIPKLDVDGCIILRRI